MSVRASSAVWHASRTEGHDRLVLLALAEHANPDGLCWPSIDRVAEMCRLSRSTVQRAMNEIVLSGEMLRTTRAGRGNTNLYQLVLPGLGPPVDNCGKQVRLTPFSQENRSNPDKTGQNGPEKQVTVDLQNQKQEPSLEPRPDDFDFDAPLDPDYAIHIAHIREQAGLQKGKPDR